jgi:uncharacterized membrane protein YGL010W
MGMMTAQHRIPATTALVLAFWSAAAVLVTMVDHALRPSPLCVAAKVLVILTAALAYVKLTASDATLEHALLAGVAWLVLGIIAELWMTSRSGHGWYAMLGAPGHTVVRDVLLAAWALAPALCVRGTRR